MFHWTIYIFNKPPHPFSTGNLHAKGKVDKTKRIEGRRKRKRTRAGGRKSRERKPRKGKGRLELKVGEEMSPKVGGLAPDFNFKIEG